MKNNWQRRTFRKSNIENFFVSDLVLSKVIGNIKDPADEKLGRNWEGPYKIIKLASKGDYNLEGLEGKQVPKP